MLFRIGWAVALVGFLASTMFQVKRIDEITPDECLRDYTFIWTRDINAFLSANRDICDRYIIFASFLMDFMLLNFFWMWLNYWKSYKMIIAYVLFFGCRGLVQVRKPPFSQNF